MHHTLATFSLALTVMKHGRNTHDIQHKYSSKSMADKREKQWQTKALIINCPLLFSGISAPIVYVD
jgi:uncharacterized protein YceK